MKAKDLLRRVRKLGCTAVHSKGSHVKVICGRCRTIVPVRAGEDLGPG